MDQNAEGQLADLKSVHRMVCAQMAKLRDENKTLRELNDKLTILHGSIRMECIALRKEHMADKRVMADLRVQLAEAKNEKGSL